MRVFVDTDVCDAHGECLIEAPEVFALSDDDETVRILVAEPPGRLHTAVEKAMSVCPVSAIYVER
jgi:ferredoxin